MQPVVDIRYQVHHAGTAKIFFTPAIGLGERAQRLAFVAIGKTIERKQHAGGHRLGRRGARRAQRFDFRLKFRDCVADLRAHRCEFLTLGIVMRRQLFQLGLCRLDQLHHFEQLVLGFAAIEFFGADLDEEGLIFLVVVGVLLLEAELFDARFAGLDVELECPRPGLKFADLGVREFDPLGQIVDLALLNPDVLACCIQASLSFAERLIGTEEFHQSDVSRTHFVNSSLARPAPPTIRHGPRHKTSNHALWTIGAELERVAPKEFTRNKKEKVEAGAQGCLALRKSGSRNANLTPRLPKDITPVLGFGLTASTRGLYRAAIP